MTKTSISHPLQIAEVSAGLKLGRIGITFCPGKYDLQAMTGAWNRDLSLDLDAIRDWGATAIVSLLEPEELTLLHVKHLGEKIRQKKMLWFHLPIKDVCIPNDDFEQRWQVAGNEIIGMLREGRNILVHCRGGLGRAGTIAARLLIEIGIDPKIAISEVRAVRPGAIETVEQEKYVLSIRRAAE